MKLQNNNKQTIENNTNKELISILRKTKKTNQSNSKVIQTTLKSVIKDLNNKSSSFQNNINSTTLIDLNSATTNENKQQKHKINSKKTIVSNVESSTTTTKRPQKPRRRVATVAQRRAANIRERRRMFNLNAAFDRLRKKVPSFAYEKRLSRIETLKLAIMYIRFMDDLVNDDAYAEKYKQLTSTINSNTSQHNNSLMNLHTLPPSESPNNDNQQQQINHSLNSRACTAANCPDYFSSQNSSYLPIYNHSGSSFSRAGYSNIQPQHGMINNNTSKKFKQTQLNDSQTIKNELIDCHEDCCSLFVNSKNNNSTQQQYRFSNGKILTEPSNNGGLNFLSSATKTTRPSSSTTKSSVTNCDSSLSSSSASSLSSSSSSPLSSSTFSMIDSTNSSPVAFPKRHLSIQGTNNVANTNYTNLVDTQQQENFSSSNLPAQPQQRYSSPSTYSDHFQDSISILPYYNNCETKYYNNNNLDQTSAKQPTGNVNQCYSNNNRTYQQHSEKQDNIDLNPLQSNNQQLGTLEVSANNHYSLHSLEAR